MQSYHKIGILGGGQLGKMLIQEGLNYPIDFYVLDPDANCPCADICKNFTVGNFNDFETVLSFGKNLDCISIEIENVNTEALYQLRNLGVKVIPEPEAIEIIKNKSIQKRFYKENNLPSSEYIDIENPSLLDIPPMEFPFFLKQSQGGYDGKGVKKINNLDELKNSFTEHSIAEKNINPTKEIAVIVCRNSAGEIKSFPSVESVFIPNKHLVDYLICPSNISIEIENRAQELAQKIIEKLNMTGILAVEFFVDQENKVWINEIAPRPHNSGHQSIEANISSQFDQLLRCLQNLPLGDTSIISPSAMVNVLGEENHAGEVIYQGLETILGKKGIYLHLYGKKITKPYRKMGHVTILGNKNLEIMDAVAFVKNNIKSISIKKLDN